MSTSEDILFFNEHPEIGGPLFQAVIDAQKDLIVLIHQNKLILFNKAFKDFSDRMTIKDFLREYGSLESRFVPHNHYFHAGKADDPEAWIEALSEFPEDKRIVSMLNSQVQPHAFSVTISQPIEEYTILTFNDISKDLIKRILIENDASIDKPSGAYDRDYFLHTAVHFEDAADFNKTSIGITLIQLKSTDRDDQEALQNFTAHLKGSVRQSDMLVRWGSESFLLIYLIDNPENALILSQKLYDV